ncbi:transcriptional regulator [Candidatus Saccharibacteria bacterium]|nr:transcriptional regulator [Candidatus Saccharibacteria bacterium]
MIDALFGSKTRVKLLHLFLNNPGQSYFVREITRKIDEQINSVRRELSNMMDVGIITCDSADNKLYYQVNQRYDHYVPLRAIFGDTPMDVKLSVHHKSDDESADKYGKVLSELTGLRLAILAGVLVRGSTTDIDILLVGNVAPNKVKSLMKDVEKTEGRDINYSVLSYDEFYYRLSVHDKFITEILTGSHKIVVDKDNVLTKVDGDK